MLKLSANGWLVQPVAQADTGCLSQLAASRWSATTWRLPERVELSLSDGTEIFAQVFRVALILSQCQGREI